MGAAEVIPHRSKLIVVGALLAAAVWAAPAWAEAPWWREEGKLKKPLPTGTTIELDTADAASVQAARYLAGYMRLLEYPPGKAGAYEAQCTAKGQRFVGVFFDLLMSQTHPVCMDSGPVTEDRAWALCGVIWQRRDALFALHGQPEREPPYTVAAVKGTHVTCRVGGEA
jgi:hypothetical protein